MSTDNAAVKQDIVSVSAQVNGPVIDVAVRNGAHVRRGDLLFRIDPAPYRVALEQAQAQLAAARLQTTQLPLAFWAGMIANSLPVPAPTLST